MAARGGKATKPGGQIDLRFDRNLRTPFMASNFNVRIDYHVHQIGSRVPRTMCATCIIRSGHGIIPRCSRYYGRDPSRVVRGE